MTAYPFWLAQSALQGKKQNLSMSLNLHELVLLHTKTQLQYFISDLFHLPPILGMLDLQAAEKILHPAAAVVVQVLAVQLAGLEPLPLDAYVPVGVAVYNISATQVQLPG